jgi:hypothetical protein
MDEIDRFVCDGNIANFANRLRKEHDPAKQETLKRLLIEEEDRFGATVERLRVLERYIADGSALIIRQADLVAKLDGDGRDAREAQRALRNFHMVQRLFLDCRARIHEQVEQLRR